MERLDEREFRAQLVDAVTTLCHRRLDYRSTMRVDGLIGITLDDSCVILVNLNKSSGIVIDREPVTASGTTPVLQSEAITSRPPMFLGSTLYDSQSWSSPTGASAMTDGNSTSLSTPVPAPVNMVRSELTPPVSSQDFSTPASSFSQLPVREDTDLLPPKLIKIELINNDADNQHPTQEPNVDRGGKASKPYIVDSESNNSTSLHNPRGDTGQAGFLLDNADVVEVKPCQCLKCDRSFDHWRGLAGHMKLHTKGKKKKRAKVQAAHKVLVRKVKRRKRKHTSASGTRVKDERENKQDIKPISVQVETLDQDLVIATDVKPVGRAKKRRLKGLSLECERLTCSLLAGSVPVEARGKRP